MAMADNKIIVIPDGKIRDYIDGKFRSDTPEECDEQRNIICKFMSRAMSEQSTKRSDCGL